MPNWNKTKYVFTGSETEISELNQIINKSLNDESLHSGDFGNDWLGFIVKELNENPQEIDCRGTICELKLINKTTLRFTTWTAWSSCYELFELICKKYPSLEYYFISREPAMNVYKTNDREKKYFKYGKNYDVLDKDMIQKIIELKKQLRKYEMAMPNDSIYIKLSTK